MPEVARDHLVNGVIQSRWHRRGDAAFGRPFAYTDPTELKTQYDREKAWYKKLWGKVFYTKPPLAWVVADADDGVIPTASILTRKTGEIKTSVVDPRFIIPVWDERIILAMDAYEREQDAKAGG